MLVWKSFYLAAFVYKVYNKFLNYTSRVEIRMHLCEEAHYALTTNAKCFSQKNDLKYNFIMFCNYNSYILYYFFKIYILVQ